VEGLPSALVVALDKPAFLVTRYNSFAECYDHCTRQRHPFRVQHLTKWPRTPFLFVFTFSSKQNIRLYIHHIIITCITETSHIHHNYHRIITIITNNSQTSHIHITCITTYFTTHHRIIKFNQVSPTSTSFTYIKYHQHSQNKFTRVSRRWWPVSFIQRRVGRSMRVIWCCRLILNREEIACVSQDKYILYTTKIFILTRVEKWEGGGGVNISYVTTFMKHYQFVFIIVSTYDIMISR
jgi:hypothetical protein